MDTLPFRRLQGQRSRELSASADSPILPSRFPLHLPQPPISMQTLACLSLALHCRAVGINYLVVRMSRRNTSFSNANFHARERLIEAVNRLKRQAVFAWKLAAGAGCSGKTGLEGIGEIAEGR